MRNLKEMIKNNTSKIVTIVVFLFILGLYINQVNVGIETKIELAKNEQALVEAKKPSEVDIIRKDIVQYAQLRSDIIASNEEIDVSISVLEETKIDNNNLINEIEHKIRCNRIKFGQQFDIDCEIDYMNYPVK